MEIVLTAVEEGLANAWERFCGGLAGIRIHRGSIFDVPCDAVVSPANSFGFMDGGIDALYLEHWGKDLQDRARAMIQDRHYGELLVGEADIIEIGCEVRYMIVAPTMRIPMVLRDSINPYLAARAVFLLLKYGRFPEGPQKGELISESVHAVAMPGLGTGVGQVGPNTCAGQVRSAFQEVFLGQRTPPKTWAEASERHQSLYTSRPDRLQR